MKILVYIQQENGKINPISTEALVGAQKIIEKIGGSVSAVTFNSEAGNHLTSYNLQDIILIEDDQLNEFNPLFYVKAIESVIESESPDVVILGHSYEARDWVPRLSARLDIPLISDCIGFNNDNNEGLTFTRSTYQGKLNSDISINSSKYIISFQSGSFRVDDISLGNSIIKKMDVDFSTIPNIIVPENKFQETAQAVDLTQAEVIISIGRGIGNEENIEMARELTSLLNGELASSRPVVDSGWLESARQVGSSGQTVSPKLYFAIGISGAIQHMVGMKSSKNIVAINKDKNAPIFESSDYGIVGDIFEVVPKLIETLKNN